MKILQKIKLENGVKEFYFLGVRIFSYISKTSQFKNVKINNGSFVDGNSSIGEYSYIGHNCFITKAQIGRYCSIANNVTIGAGEHDLTNISTSSLFYKNNAYDELTKLPLQIGNDVWIGVDSIIRRGISIGDGAVVGANSFVNKDVPDFAIVAGTPARIIGYRFSEKKRKKIKNTNWWLYPIDEAKKIISDLENISD